MTKDEYEKLLNSEYWKGYSYSLIKERNFTCEDCGRRFFNERNKLQVHHLIYRDTNPWSYKPNELLVLCEECHKKRHGLLTDAALTSEATQTTDGYSNSYSFSRESKEEKPTSAVINTFKRLLTVPRFRFSWLRSYRFSKPRPYHFSKHRPYRFSTNRRKHFWSKIKIAFLLLLIFMFMRAIIDEDPPAEAEVAEEIPKLPANGKKNVRRSKLSSKATVEKPVADETFDQPTENECAMEIAAEEPINEAAGDLDESEDAMPYERELQTPLAENHEAGINKADGNEQGGAKKEELSTTEILERMHHADVVKRAKAAGISTEGTTTEILERMHHADVE